MYWLVKFKCVPFLKLSKISIVLLILGSHYTCCYMTIMILFVEVINNKQEKDLFSVFSTSFVYYNTKFFFL